MKVLFAPFLLLLFALPARAADTLSAEEIRADFKQLYETLQERDPELFVHFDKPHYDSLYQASLDAIAGDEAVPEAAKRFQRFVAAGGVSHARIDANYAAFRDYLAKGGRAFPLYLKLVHGRYYVAENRSGLKSIRRGEEVYAINREPIRAWFARAAQNFSADTAFMAQTQLETDFPMALWLELGPAADHVELTFARRKVLFHKVVPFLTEAELAANAKKQPPVLVLDGHSRKARVFGALAYLRPGIFRNFRGGGDESEFKQFLAEAFDGFRSRESRALLIDLRDNPGGGDAFAADLVAWFAKIPFRLHAGGPLVEPQGGHFDGKTYVLVNRNSYSACTVVAAAVQDQHLALVIGEKTADLATNQTAIETFKLDNSGLVVGFPTQTVTRPAGETAPRSVLPDVLIDTPVIEDPGDPVLRQAFDLMTK
ncbi:MAG TPA: S41 family peptidase [Magnetospirillaceae bacterium]|nr:S41 family peptidase [Magnetospirillaceae bacterium]